MKPTFISAKISSLFFCLSIILTIGAMPLSADDQVKTVVTTGEVSIKGDNVYGARQASIQEALRKAVEQGVGMVMNATDIVQNDDLMEKIYTHTEGHITAYKVLKEKQTDGGSYKVEVQAEVNTGKINYELFKLNLKPAQDYPRVMLLPFPDAIGQEDARVAEAAFISELTQNKFDVVDPDQSSKIHSDIKALFGTDAVNSVAARIGLEHQAEIVILYEVKTGGSEFDGMMEHIQSSFTTRAIQTTTAQILGSETVSSIGLGTSQDTARQNSVKQTAEKNCVTTMDSVISWWADYTANGAPYIITLKTPAKATRQIFDFQDALSEIPGVVSVSERSSGGGITEMMIKYKFSSKDLKRGIFDSLEMKRGFENLYFELSKGRFIVISL